MKVKVINRFIDKETRVLNECGSVIDVTEPRFIELSAGGFVKEIEAKKPAKKAATKKATK